MDEDIVMGPAADNPLVCALQWLCDRILRLAGAVRRGRTGEVPILQERASAAAADPKKADVYGF